MIKLERVLKQLQMKQPGGKYLPHNITFVKADEKRKTAGEVVAAEQARFYSYNRQKRMLLLNLPRTEHLVPVHIDLILWFNRQPVA